MGASGREPATPAKRCVLSLAQGTWVCALCFLCRVETRGLAQTRARPSYRSGQIANGGSLVSGTPGAGTPPRREGLWQSLVHRQIPSPGGRCYPCLLAIPSGRLPFAAEEPMPSPSALACVRCSTSYPIACYWSDCPACRAAAAPANLTVRYEEAPGA